jgi:hypothetical protein
VPSSQTTQQTPSTWRVPATGRSLLLWGLDRAWLRGQAPLPPHRRGGPTSTRSWPKHASGAVASRLYRGGSLYARRARARAGQTSPRSHQHRLQRRQSRYAPASEPKAHSRRNTAVGHARPFDARGAEPALRGAGSHRASGRPTGRKLGVPHPPAGERARLRALGTRGRRGAAPRQPGAHAGQGAAPRHAREGPRRLRPQRHQRPTDEQRRGTGGSRLPPSVGWTLRQRGGPLTDAGAP